MPSQPLDRRSVDQQRTVYRFVRTADREDPDLRNDFHSDRARAALEGAEYIPVDREAEFPELQDSMSVFGSPEPMRERWSRISARAAAKGQTVKLGDFIAELNLEPGEDCWIEDLGEEDQHMHLWGDPDRLASAVVIIEPAATERG
jgi:hypothetical protein